MRRIAGGVAGWLVALAPLLGVNIAGFVGVFDTETAVVAGAGALVGGIALGALVTGLIAGRPQRPQQSQSSSSGAAATLPAGLVAGGLYAVSLIAIVAVAIHSGAAPAVVAEHPLRIAGAIICLGALLLGLSLLCGMLVGKRSAHALPQHAPALETRRPGAMQPRYMMNPDQPQRDYENRHISGYGARQGAGDSGRREDSRDSRDASNYDTRGRDIRRDYDGARERGYGGYDERQPMPQHSSLPVRPPTRYPPGSGPRRNGENAAREDDWRDDWR